MTAARILVVDDEEPLLDLRMPTMDGHTFLRRLAPLGLGASVIVTSGTGDMDDVIDVLRHGAIDYVKKPWEPSELRTALGRAIELRATRTPSTPGAPRSDVFQELLARIQSGEILLPSVPAVVQQLRKIVGGKATTIEAVTKLVSQDQALVTRVLQLGQSAMYASFQIGDLEMTITRIGFQSLHTLAETVWLKNCFQVRDPRFTPYTERLDMVGERDLTEETPVSAAEADACARALGIDAQTRQRAVSAAMLELTSLLNAR